MLLHRAKPILLLAALYGAAAPAALMAQAYETSGIQLTFGTSLMIEATDNKGLRADDKESSLNPVLGLSFGLLTATPTSSFGFNADSEIRSSVNTDNLGVASPLLSTTYARKSANAALDLSASVQKTDLSRNDAPVVDSSGLVGFVTGTATRRAAVADAALNWGLNSRVSYGLSGQMSDVTYSGGVANGLNGSSLTDNRRVTLGGTAQLDLTKATQLNTGLSYSRFDDDGVPGSSDTVTATVGLSIDRPLGAVTATLRATDTDEGQRYGLSVGRTLNMPLGPVSVEIGVTTTLNGDTALRGAVSASRTLPTGTLSFALTRDVSSLNEQDSERLSTQLSLGYSRELSPLSELQVAFDLAEVEDMFSNARSLDANLGATYSRTLMKDWSASAGYRYRYLEDTPGDTAQSNTVFLELRRSFVTRY
jgi:hypothetical protein